MTWSIVQADAVEFLSGLAPASVDAVVTDPPYGERAASWDSPRSREWHEAWVSAAHRALKPGAPLVAFFSRRYLDVLMGAIRVVRGDDPGCPLQSAVWVHRQGHTSRDGFLRPEHEPVIISGNVRAKSDDVRRMRSYGSPHNMQRRATHRRSAARGFKPTTYVPHEAGPMGGTVLECSRSKFAEAVGHPTQKPEAVIEYFVVLACAPGGLVVDCYGGSFTTAVVAVRLGRDFAGCDTSAEYVEMGRRRLIADAPLWNTPSPETETA